MTDRDIKRWQKYATVITSGDTYWSSEILGILLEKLAYKLNTTPNFTITDNYVFISLKNTYIKELKKEATRNNHIKIDQRYSTNSTGGEDDFKLEIPSYDYNIYNLEIDREEQSKLDLITDIVLEFDYFSKALYVLHFIRGYSQRRISRESGITLAVINKKINDIKAKLVQRYEERCPK